MAVFDAASDANSGVGRKLTSEINTALAASGSRTRLGLALMVSVTVSPGCGGMLELLQRCHAVLQRLVEGRAIGEGPGHLVAIRRYSAIPLGAADRIDLGVSVHQSTPR